jgi:uncharacterized protein YkwD
MQREGIVLVRLSLPLAAKFVGQNPVGRKLVKVVVAAVVTLGAVAGSTAFAAPAFASPSGDLAAATNASRAAAGLPGLRVDGQLSAVAQAWANHLAAANALSHNGALRGQVSNWTNLGENVGMAADIPSVQRAFMNSPEHRANILNSKYTLMGVGSATSILPSCNCKVLWVVVDFKRPATAAAPAPAPAKQVKPAPVQPARPAQPVRPAQPAQPPVHKVAQPAQPVQAAQAAQHAHAVAPAPSTPQSPSPSASASALGSQLVAAASSPATPNANDPVSQLLTFATIMSGLPG